MKANEAILIQSIKVFESLLNGKYQQALSVTMSDGCSEEERIFCERFNLFLQKYQQGMHFVSEVSKGNLAVESPANNRIVEPFKQLHADLRHLVWQTKRLTEGDLNHKVMFMGDFSDSFNSLIASLKERRELLEKIHESERFYKGILKIAPDDISITDTQGRLTFVSQKGVEIFGYTTPEELLGGNISDHLTLAYREKMAEAILKMLQGFYTGPAEYQAVKKDGSLMWIDANAEVLCRNTGEPEAMLFVIRDITHKRALEQKLLEYAENMANHARMDQMTGMLNRAEGINVLASELERSIRHHDDLAVIFIDLDGLKLANDCFGHEEGDRLILEIAKVIQSSIRATDHVARMGGDEFIIILPKIDQPGVQKIIARIDDHVKQANAQEGANTLLAYSYGVSFSTSQAPLTIEELINQADNKMYDQKKAKRSAVESERIEDNRLHEADARLNRRGEHHD